MVKTQRKFLHERPKGANERNFYRSLFAILLLIAATAVVLNHAGLSSEDSASGDLVGMATGEINVNDYTLVSGKFIPSGNKYEIILEHNSNKERYQYSLIAMGSNIYAEYTNSDGKIFYTDKDGFRWIKDASTEKLTKTEDRDPIVTKEDGTTAFQGFTKMMEEAKTKITPFNAEDEMIVSTTYTPSDSSFNIVTKDSNNNEYTTKYTIVTENNQLFAKYTPEGVGQDLYTDKDGNTWVKDSSGILTQTIYKDPTLTGADGSVLDVFSIVINPEASSTDTTTSNNYEAKQTTPSLTEEYAQVAASLGLSPEKGVPAVEAEDKAINSYLDDNGLGKWDYDVSTGKYSCATCATPVYYSGDKMLIETSLDGGKSNVYIYQEKNGLNPATYHVCSDITCDDAKTYAGNDLAQIKDKYKTAKRDAENTDKTIQRAMDSGDRIPMLNANGNPVLDSDGKPKYVKSTLRQRQYMDKIYQQQESQVVGLLSGYLNNWIDEKLGSFSRGVPAGICKYIFGLDYYKNAGWVAVPANTSSSQLQNQLIANSRTVMIEGEKEEITENLFRYAYTIRLLVNQSLEWQTYLSNSCSGKTSVEQFYDYGALAPGAYFAFHYAGSGEQDMTFDCTQEDCLYDQACVAFTDSTAPVCVSLVHGAGFETPNAGSDYDCAITG